MMSGGQITVGKSVDQLVGGLGRALGGDSCGTELVDE